MKSDTNHNPAAITAGDTSPFDSLRRVDENGEFWSARDLMAPLGYDSWRRFDDAIERAKASCINANSDVTSNFAGAVKNSTGAGRPGDDYRLTRFAAYLVAMNGDPRKPEIAQAQQYFAVKTREAETVAAPEATTAPTVDLEAASRILAILQPFSNPDWVEAQARIILGRAIGAEPEIEPDRRPLTVDEYLEGRGLTRRNCDDIRATFGKRLAAQYRAAKGAEPFKGDRNIAGRITKVNVYSEQERPLFDAVWSQFYAGKLAVTR